jgi:hypothetical protein
LAQAERPNQPPIKASFSWLPGSLILQDIRVHDEALPFGHRVHSRLKIKVSGFLHFHPCFDSPGFSAGNYIISAVWWAVNEIRAIDLIEPEWLDWYMLEPIQRWEESQKLWATFFLLGGSLDAEPDSQSPFHDAAAPGQVPAHGGAGLRVLRSCGI